LLSGIQIVVSCECPEVGEAMKYSENVTDLNDLSATVTHGKDSMIIFLSRCFSEELEPALFLKSNQLEIGFSFG